MCGLAKKTIEKTLADDTPNGFSAGQAREALWNHLSDTDRLELFCSKMFEEEVIQWIAQRNQRAFRAAYGQPKEFDSKMSDEEAIARLKKNTFRACYAQPTEAAQEREEVDEEATAKLKPNIFRACYAQPKEPVQEREEALCEALPADNRKHSDFLLSPTRRQRRTPMPERKSRTPMPERSRSLPQPARPRRTPMRFTPQQKHTISFAVFVIREGQAGGKGVAVADGAAREINEVNANARSGAAGQVFCVPLTSEELITKAQTGDHNCACTTPMARTTTKKENLMPFEAPDCRAEQAKQKKTYIASCICSTPLSSESAS